MEAVDLPIPEAIGLPEPSPEALAHSRQLRQHLKQLITDSGPLRFDRYWDEVMYAPGLGYYAAGAAKFGAAGDFVTAPELGPAFARCMAGQIAEALVGVDGDTVLELGAGSGAFAAVALQSLQQADALPRRYWILERSAELAERQRKHLRETLGDLVERVEWLEQLPQQPWRGVIFGNEVVDALAPRRLLRDAPGWRELYVGWQGGELTWMAGALTADLQSACSSIEALWQDETPRLPYLTEVQSCLPAWIAALTATLERGLLLLVDYGYTRREYYHPQRHDGTLICHYRHRAHQDALLWPGLCDLSVSVDFSALQQATLDAELTPIGHASQAMFLIEAGLQQQLDEIQMLAEAERLERLNEIKRLMLPAEMGERFSVYAAGRNWAGPLSGYAAANTLGRL